MKGTWGTEIRGIPHEADRALFGTLPPKHWTDFNLLTLPCHHASLSLMWVCEGWTYWVLIMTVQHATAVALWRERLPRPLVFLCGMSVPYLDLSDLFQAPCLSSLAWPTSC